MPNATALLVIDIQNDFCEGGALAVPGGSQIVPGVNQLIQDSELTILSQDWHPAEHKSFASEHSDKVPYDVVQMPYGPQVLWPNHCIQGSKGAQFHANLDTSKAHAIIRKGHRAAIDSYSAFYENDHATSTGLVGYLRDLNVTAVRVVGLALDFCVQYTALDAKRLGFDVEVISGLCKAIDLQGSKGAALRAMHDGGIIIK